MTTNPVSETSTQEQSLVGRVKWFNNKAGTGFITITDGPQSGTDVFVHHSAIVTENKQFLYLVQGEYVEFSLVPAHKEANKDNNKTFESQAGTVRGIKGGKLMCETRLDTRQIRTTYSEETAEPVKQPRIEGGRGPRPPRTEGGRGPRPQGGRGPTEGGRGPRPPRPQGGRGPRTEGGRGPRPPRTQEREKEWTLVKEGPNK